MKDYIAYVNLATLKEDLKSHNSCMSKAANIVIDALIDQNKKMKRALSYISGASTCVQYVSQSEHKEDFQTIAKEVLKEIDE